MREPDIDLRHGNCLDILPTLPDCSVDSIVTDPPYEIGFMNRNWDNSGIAYNQELWQECLRVLKPGGHLLAFGGTRTYHRMACAIEDAGFEIRDSIHWLYGSGFPKSLDVSKAIDKMDAKEDQQARRFRFTAWVCSTGVTAKKIDEATETFMGSHYTTHPTQPAVMTREHLEACRHLFSDIPAWVERECDIRSVESRNMAEREIIGSKTSGIANKDEGPRHTIGASKSIEVDITAPATDAARQWAGWGTALKPAHEPIVVARKPIVGTVAANVLEYGTGAINIDASRIAGVPPSVPQPKFGVAQGVYEFGSGEGRNGTMSQAAGRWPANVILSHTEDCQQVGVRDDTYQINRLEEWSGFGQKKQPDYDGSGRSVSVPVWECVPGCPVALLDEQSGVSKDGVATRRNGNQAKGLFPVKIAEGSADVGYGGSGGASRFFYCAKPSRKERNAGLDELPKEKPLYTSGTGLSLNGDGTLRSTISSNQNHHPTVKPLALMRYLVRLVTPPGGTVLEPFAGSGTTLMACVLEGFDAIGIEMTDEYLPIIEGRIAWAQEQANQQPESDQQELPL